MIHTSATIAARWRELRSRWSPRTMSLTGWVIKNGKRPADEPAAAAEPEAKAAKLAVETSAGASL